MLRSEWPSSEPTNMVDRNSFLLLNYSFYDRPERTDLLRCFMLILYDLSIKVDTKFVNN